MKTVKCVSKDCWRAVLQAAVLIAAGYYAQAQGGNAGITEATKGNFANGTNLMYDSGAIVRPVGAVKVYNK